MTKVKRFCKCNLVKLKISFLTFAK